MAAAFCQNSLMETAAEVFRKLVDLVIAVNFDGLFGGIHHHVAFVAPMEVLIQLSFQVIAYLAVKIIGQLLQEIFALHGWPSPLGLDLKYLARRSRSCKRARRSLDFTAGTLSPSISAVSSVESPSTSLNTNTVLNPGESP